MHIDIIPWHGPGVLHPASDYTLNLQVWCSRPYFPLEKKYEDDVPRVSQLESSRRALHALKSYSCNDVGFPK